jgi:hypothetical protein
MFWILYFLIVFPLSKYYFYSQEKPQEQLLKICSYESIKEALLCSLRAGHISSASIFYLSGAYLGTKNETYVLTFVWMCILLLTFPLYSSGFILVLACFFDIHIHLFIKSLPHPSTSLAMSLRPILLPSVFLWSILIRLVNSWWMHGFLTNLPP